MSIPDAQIFPHATAAAAATVAKHEAPQDLIFYGGWVRHFHVDFIDKIG